MSEAMTKSFALNFVLLLCGSASAQGTVGVFREIPLPNPASGPTSVALAAGGLWFTEFHGNKIGRINPDGTVTEFVIPTPKSGPMGITGYGDTIWFTEFNANKIGKITPSGVITEYSVPTPESGPFDISLGSSGDVWFTEFEANKIGRITNTGVITEFPIPTPNSGPMGIGRGADGETWFTEFRGDKLARILSGGAVQEMVPLASGSGPTDLSYGDGSLWFTAFLGNRIGMIRNNVLSEFPVPTAGGGPWNIVAGYEGSNAWFTERLANKIGYVWANGRMTEYEIPDRGGEPMGIELLLEKAWFAERSGNAISSVQPDAVLVPGAGTVGTWDTVFRFANLDPQPVTVLTSIIPLPQRVCAGACFPEGRTALPGFGVGGIIASENRLNGIMTLYVRALESGVVPSVSVRMVNNQRPSQADPLPVIRLSTLTALNPTLLAFPGVTTTASARSSLVLVSVNAGLGVRLGPPGGLSVRVEAVSNAGEVLGASSFQLFPGHTLLLGDVLAHLGVPNLEDGHIRVTKTGGGDLLWGYLATVTADGGVSIIAGLNP